MESPNGNSAVATAQEPSTYQRHVLTDKQREFFQMGRANIQAITLQMNGALQCICMENNIKGNATLSDDGTEVIIELQG